MGHACADDIETLAGLKMFADLSPVALRQLAAVTTPQTYDDGQLITLEGTPDAPMFFVVTGTVRAFRTNLDGREQTLIYLKPGTAFNMPVAFARDHSAPASAVAIGPVELLRISRHDFRRVTSETPEIALAVLRDFSDKLRHFTEMTHDLSLRSVRGRLARFLLTHAATAQDEPIRWTQEEIAARVGTVREVVSRTLRDFIKAGLIQTERQRITVLDPEGLQRESRS
jgi:CRP/FNR family transcriptional regulator